RIKESNPKCKLHWVVRRDMAAVVRLHTGVDQIWELDRSSGLTGILRLARKLKQERYTHIYDAHLVIRSILLMILMLFDWTVFFHRPKIAIRSKNRFKRFLLFRFQINRFTNWPFIGVRSYLAPLAPWGVDGSLPLIAATFPGELLQKLVRRLKDDSLAPGSFIALVPGAAWPLKEWPLSYWIKLVDLHPTKKFIILGGPADPKSQELVAKLKGRVVDFSGKLTIAESGAVVQLAAVTVVADTGLLHLADLFGARALAIIGPTAFGFPAGSWIDIVEHKMDCRPCTKDGRGQCPRPTPAECMMAITPEDISARLQLLDGL
ncbi:MAG: glycosyltransferase family 9 protein, partial [Bdellovibrionales bacterium]|nr:glycosyltransferase family 9 protein [Bdellovibrionales bacterium]